MTKRRLASYGLNLVGVALLYALFTLAFACNAFGKSTIYIQGICTTACYTIIMVTSLNLVVGFMGEFSMGHAGFVSVGAYVSAIVSGALAGHGLSDLALLIKHTATYKELKPLYSEYKKSHDKEKYLRGREREIILFEASARALKAAGVGDKLPDLAKLREEYSRLSEEKNRLYAEYCNCTKE